jgi:universal stress protein A
MNLNSPKPSGSSGAAADAGEKQSAASTGPAPEVNVKRILVPVDLSDGAKKAVQYGAALARQFGASITLLHFLERPYMAGLGMHPGEFAKLQAPLREAAMAKMAEWQKTFLGGIASEVSVSYGNSHEEIVIAAKDLGIDLIVIATHGRTGLAHVVMGSTAEYVVQHASCPVLVVHE